MLQAAHFLKCCPLLEILVLHHPNFSIASNIKESIAQKSRTDHN
jgi:hypothetical protein